jgi:type I restriction enzyme S subunit
MSNLKTLTLRDVCQATQGVQIPKSSQSKIPKKNFKRYFYISDFTHDKNLKYVEDKYSKKNFTCEDIIVSNTGSHGEVFIGKEGILSNNLFKVTFDKKIINGSFLVLFLKSNLFKDFQLKRVKGTANPHMGHENFLDTPIILPPLPVQQKIVAKLDKIFAEINNLESILQNKLSQVKMINNIIISSLVEKEKNLKKINLNNICNIKGRIGYRGYTKKDITTKGLGAISLSPSNIIDSKLDFKKVTYVSWKKYEESPEIMINPGDIVFCKTGSTYGKTAYVEYLPEKATLNPQLVTLKNIKCNKKYLFYYMMTEKFKFQIKEIVGGTAMPTLSQEKFGETIIELPPEDSQEVIVNKIDQSIKNVEKIFINIKIMIDNIHSLKSKVLQKNFMYE